MVSFLHLNIIQDKLLKFPFWIGFGWVGLLNLGKLYQTLLSNSISGSAFYASMNTSSGLRPLLWRHPGLIAPMLSLSDFFSCVLDTGQCCACKLALRKANKHTLISSICQFTCINIPTMATSKLPTWGIGKKCSTDPQTLARAGYDTLYISVFADIIWVSVLGVCMAFAPDPFLSSLIFMNCVY